MAHVVKLSEREFKYLLLMIQALVEKVNKTIIWTDIWGISAEIGKL